MARKPETESSIETAVLLVTYNSSVLQGMSQHEPLANRIIFSLDAVNPKYIPTEPRTAITGLSGSIICDEEKGL